MGRRTLIVTLFMLVATLGFSQQSSQAKWAVTLSIANPVESPGAPIDITVVAKNISSEPTSWSTLCSAVLDYKFTVLGPDGKPVKPTPLYDRMLKGPAVIECATELIVAPGKEFKLDGNLAEYFEMTAPGQYVVQATRESLASNTLEITITN